MGARAQILAHESRRCRPRPSPHRDRSAAPSGSPRSCRIQASMSLVSMASRSPWTSWTMRPPWRSMDGISMCSRVSTSRTGTPRGRARNCFELPRPRARRSGRSTPPAPRRRGRSVKTSDEVLERAGAAGRDHRDRHGGRNGGRQLAVEAGIACRRDRSRSAGSRRRRAPRPRAPTRRHRARRQPSPLRANTAKPIAVAFRVDRHDHGLAAVAAGERVIERRVRERRAVEADLVGARVDGRRRVVFACGCRRRPRAG